MMLRIFSGTSLSLLLPLQAWVWMIWMSLRETS